MGALPDTGKWTRLSKWTPISSASSPATSITGLAYTQFGGTVYWDKAGITGRKDPAADATLSQLVWEKQHDGKNTPELPADINAIFRGVNRKDRNAAQQKTAPQLFHRQRLRRREDPLSIC